MGNHEEFVCSFGKHTYSFPCESCRKMLAFTMGLGGSNHRCLLQAPQPEISSMQAGMICEPDGSVRVA